MLVHWEVVFVHCQDDGLNANGRKCEFILCQYSNYVLISYVVESALYGIICNVAEANYWSLSDAYTRRVTVTSVVVSLYSTYRNNCMLILYHIAVLF